MNTEQQEHLICCIIRETCERMDVEVSFDVGEYSEDCERNVTTSEMVTTYRFGRRNLRNSGIAIALYAASAVWFIVSKASLDLAVMIAALAIAVYYHFQKIATPAQLEAAIDANLNKAGFGTRHDTTGTRTITWRAQA